MTKNLCILQIICDLSYPITPAIHHLHHVTYHIPHVHFFKSPLSHMPYISYQNVTYHMSYLTFYISDNLIHVTYHRLCWDISCHISHIIITYYIVHITHYMSLITHYRYRKVLNLTYHTVHITYEHITNLRLHIADYVG